MKMNSTLLAIALACVSLAACQEQEDQDLAEQALDAVEMAFNESALTTPTLDAYDGEMTAAELAEISAENAPTYYEPESCVDAEADGSAVTCHLDGCTGDLGIAHVTGVLEAVYTEIEGGIQADLSGDDLAVNEAVMDLDATAVLIVDGDLRDLTVTTDSSGTGPRGNEITRQGDYALETDTETNCLSLEGEWSTTVAEYYWTTSIDYSRCGEGCPRAGGSVTLHAVRKDVTVTVDFDGSATASWRSSRGSSGEIDLDCTVE